MITKEKLLKQRQLVDHKGRCIITVRTGPNRAERRRKAAKKTPKTRAKTTKRDKVRPQRAKGTRRRTMKRRQRKGGRG